MKHQTRKNKNDGSHYRDDKEGKANREEALELAAVLFDDNGEFFAETMRDAGKKPKMGRPTVMTPEVVRKLEIAFSIGCSDAEACLFAGIAKKTLYEWVKINPDFSDRKEQLKLTPVLYSRLLVVRNIIAHGSSADAWQYLMRKRKAEFSEAKQELPDGRKPLTAKQLEAVNSGEFEIIEDESDD